MVRGVIRFPVFGIQSKGPAICDLICRRLGVMFLFMAASLENLLAR